MVNELTGPAREEAIRAPAEHVQLQLDLQQLGFIPPGPVDGVYGQATRVGILAWQSARGRSVTGFLGDTDARKIEQEVVVAPVSRSGLPGPEVWGAEDVPLKKDGGIYVVPVRGDGAITLDFVDVVLPADVAMTIASTGTIAESDYIGVSQYTHGPRPFTIRQSMGYGHGTPGYFGRPHPWLVAPES